MFQVDLRCSCWLQSHMYVLQWFSMDSLVPTLCLYLCPFGWNPDVCVDSKGFSCGCLLQGAIVIEWSVFSPPRHLHLFKYLLIFFWVSSAALLRVSWKPEWLLFSISHCLPYYRYMVSQLVGAADFVSSVLLLAIWHHLPLDEALNEFVNIQELTFET